MPRYGRYQLVRRLAVGGMAEVFLATAEGEAVGRRLVVKRLLPHLGDRPQFVRMFLDEARLTSRLDHPNVVRIDGFGEAEGMHYIAMEHVDGLSLAELLYRVEQQSPSPGPVDRELACFVVAEVCAGLAYAHGQRDSRGESLAVVHRDVSPDNVLLSRAGEVKLADFGIAKARNQINRTLPGQVKGKLRYMSPEQAGRATDIDHRSDIFSAGVVLFELTTGRPLFGQVNDAELLKEIIDGAYPPPFADDFPAPLATVLEQALRKDRQLRFQRAGQMREALLAIAGGTPAAHLARLGALVQGVLPASGTWPLERDQRSTEVGSLPGGPITEPGVGRPLRLAPADVQDTIREIPVIDDLDDTHRDLEVADTIRRIEAVDDGAVDDVPVSEGPGPSSSPAAPKPFTGRPPPPGTVSPDSCLIPLGPDEGPPPVTRAGRPPTSKVRWTEQVVARRHLRWWPPPPHVWVGAAIAAILALALVLGLAC